MEDAEYRYGTLIVSSSRQMNEALLDLLPESRFTPVTVVPDVAAEFYVGDVPHDMYVGEVVEIIGGNS